ncbi:hypothetical protein [Scytonema sp. UIC 10036]|uniref:hypothetical protein n=1 Tax=Scytonema sp. UIC 10036 TaxID=2304196 RepID=UPI00140F9AA8|nr:hypothetical protein [Scytonema sp. UIC 10036]
MNLMDGLLLTLINTVACLVFPKLVSVILAKKSNSTASSPVNVTTNETGSGVPNFSQVS